MNDLKILQFGEGVFLRCFIDWMVQRMNDRAGFGGSVQIIQPRRETLSETSRILNAHGGNYRVCLRGLADGRAVEQFEEISCVAGVDVWTNAEKYATIPSLRFVVSNTTEAGIEYVRGRNTFPSKILRLLKARCAAGLPGLVFLPCELVEDNGGLLKECILRHLADEPDGPDSRKVRRYVEEDCVFCSTLVDRIVAGAIDSEPTSVCGEPFHFLAVQPPPGFDLEAEMPLAKAGVNVVHTPDLNPYRTRKVRFLNAAHTTIAYWGMERGLEEVAQVVNDSEGGVFLRELLFDEIFPTVNLPAAEKTDYANAVLERFANPFAHHKLASIALNTLAKWRTRCLPVACDYYRLYGCLPPRMMQGYEAIARHFDGV